MDQQLRGQCYLELLEMYAVISSTDQLGGQWWYLAIKPAFDTDWEECHYADIQHCVEAESKVKPSHLGAELSSKRPETGEVLCFLELKCGNVCSKQAW